MSVIFAVLLIIFSIFSRLVLHAPNFTPVISIAIFAAAYLKKPYAFLVPLAALLVSDVIIGFYGLPLMAFVYGSLVLITVASSLMHEKVSAGEVLGFSIGGAVFFFVVTNFGVWVLPNTVYPKTLAGLIECYAMAIPFFRNTLISTLIYSAALFGMHEFVTRHMLKKMVV